MRDEVLNEVTHRAVVESSSRHGDLLLGAALSWGGIAGIALGGLLVFVFLQFAGVAPIQAVVVVGMALGACAASYALAATAPRYSSRGASHSIARRFFAAMAGASTTVLLGRLLPARMMDDIQGAPTVLNALEEMALLVALYATPIVTSYLLLRTNKQAHH